MVFFNISSLFQGVGKYGVGWLSDKEGKGDEGKEENRVRNGTQLN